MGVRISLLLLKNKKVNYYVEIHQRIVQRACKQGDVAFVSATAEFDDRRDGGFGHFCCCRVGNGPDVRERDGVYLQDAR